MGLFEYATKHEKTNEFIDYTKGLLEGYVIEWEPTVQAVSGSSSPLNVTIVFGYRAGIKANNGLTKWLREMGWHVERNESYETTDGKEQRFYIFRASTSIQIPKGEPTYGGQ